MFSHILVGFSVFLLCLCLSLPRCSSAQLLPITSLSSACALPQLFSLLSPVPPVILLVFLSVYVTFWFWLLAWLLMTSPLLSLFFAPRLVIFSDLLPFYVRSELFSFKNTAFFTCSLQFWVVRVTPTSRQKMFHLLSKMHLSRLLCVSFVNLKCSFP